MRVHVQCRKANPTNKELTADELSAYFHLPINEVAKKLGLCVTVLKARCRDNGITRWPYRKVRKLDNIIRALESNQKCAGREDCKKQLAVLKETRDVLLSNPNSTAHLKLGKLRTAKKFLVALEREQPMKEAKQSPYKLSTAKPIPVKMEPGQPAGQPSLPDVDKEASKGDLLTGGSQNLLNGSQSAFRKIPVVLVQQRSTSSDDTTAPRSCGVGPLSTEQPQGTWSGGNSPHAVADFNRFFPPQGIKDEPGESKTPIMTQAGLMNMPPGWSSMMNGPAPMPHAPWLMGNMPFMPMPGFPQSPFPAHADPQQFQAFQVAYQAAFQQLMKQGLVGTQVNQNIAASH